MKWALHTDDILEDVQRISTVGIVQRCIIRTESCILAVLGAIVGIQTIDNSIISPKIMSNAIDIDPLTIMFSVIIGATLLGLWGAILAIPVLVIIKSIINVKQKLMIFPTDG